MRNRKEKREVKRKGENERIQERRGGEEKGREIENQIKKRRIGRLKERMKKTEEKSRKISNVECVGKGLRRDQKKL